MEARAAARGVPNPATASPLSDRWTSCRRRKWGAAGWVSPAGRAGWRCDRRRRREGGRGAAHRTAGAPSRPAAAPFAPLVPSSPVGPPSGVAPSPPSPHRCGAGASRPSASRRSQRPANSRWPAQPRRRRR
eukprot:scaffold2960_cov61-Phaeocystis_antarctica.AAC.7